MARLTWALLALAGGTLVAGFLIRSSSVPLLASFAFSAAVALLILIGQSRQLRRSGALDGDDEESTETTIVEIGDETAVQPETKAPRVSSHTAEIPTTAIPRQRKAPAKPKAGQAKRKAPAKPKPAARKAAPARKPAPSRPPPSRKVLVIPGRSRYHAKGCRFAKGDELREVAESTAKRRGYEPCSVCLGNKL